MRNKDTKTVKQKKAKNSGVSLTAFRACVSVALAAVLLVLTACSGGSTGVTETSVQTQPQTDVTADTTELPTESAQKELEIPDDLPAVDVDLSALSQTMMYSQTYDMIYNTESYRGKTVRMKGPFSTFTDEETGNVHHTIVIQDATACCTQGIEFELADPHAEYPAEETVVLVSGTFDTYMQDMFLFCILRDAKIEAVA